MNTAHRNLPSLVMICFTLALAACGSAPSRELPAQPVSLTNTYWQLASVKGTAMPASGTGNNPHLIFQDDGQVRGHTGCNVLRGVYGQNNGQVRFLTMGATRMACSHAAAEAAFVAAMRDTRDLSIRGRQLFLQGPDGATLAVFEVLR